MWVVDSFVLSEIINANGFTIWGRVGQVVTLYSPVNISQGEFI